jgi:hypothetical protein
LPERKKAMEIPLQASGIEGEAAIPISLAGLSRKHKPKPAEGSAEDKIRIVLEGFRK